MKKQDAAKAIAALKRATELRPDTAPIRSCWVTRYWRKVMRLFLVPRLRVIQVPWESHRLESNEPAKAMVNLQSALERYSDNPDLFLICAAPKRLRKMLLYEIKSCL